MTDAIYKGAIKQTLLLKRYWACSTCYTMYLNYLGSETLKMSRIVEH